MVEVNNFISKYNLPYICNNIRIECGVCGSKQAYKWYDLRYRGWLAYCPICDDQWKMS